MREADKGFSEWRALEAFFTLKFQLADTLLEATWGRLTKEEKSQYEKLYERMKNTDIFVREGSAFTEEHKRLLLQLH